MNRTDPPAEQTTRPTRTLSLMPTMLALVVGVAGARYWYVHSTAPDRLFRLGLDAIEANELDLVVSAAEGLRGLPGYEPQVHLLAGAVLLRSGEPIEAIVQFGYAKDAPETRAKAHTLSGEALYRTRQYRDALKILNNALQLDPAQTDAHRWLAAIYFDIGAMNHAIDHLQTVALRVPSDPRPHRLMGLIYRDFEEYRKAISAYRNSLERGPDQPDWQKVTLELADCLVKKKQYTQALETLADCPESAQKIWRCHDRFSVGPEGGGNAAKSSGGSVPEGDVGVRGERHPVGSSDGGTDGGGLSLGMASSLHSSYGLSSSRRPGKGC